MIIDKRKNAYLYFTLGERLAAGLRYLQETNLARVEPGRHEIDGTNVYAIVMEYDTEPAEECFWEAHRRYIDIQYVVSGVERMGYANLDRLETDDLYDEETDILKLKAEGDMLVVPAGHFVIFYPHEAHMPGVALDEPQLVKKAVVKVRVD